MSLLADVPRLLVLLSFAFFFVVPLVWLLLAPSKDVDQLLSLPPLSFGSFERLATTWTNLVSFNNYQMVGWIWNSVAYVVGGLALTLAVSIPAGYALAMADFAPRRIILIVTLITMIVPSAASTLPLFLEFSALKLTNTYAGMILASGFFPFGVYLAFIYFSTSIPRDLLNAARIDGATEFQVFRYVALPVTLPVVSLIAFFAFVATWNNYFLPFILITDDRLYNLPVGLGTLLSGTGAINPANINDLPIKRPEVALAGLMLAIPILLVFLFSQRFVRQGMIAGAEKS
jgi:multiple sugar transport system permease protein